MFVCFKFEATKVKVELRILKGTHLLAHSREHFIGILLAERKVDKIAFLTT